MKILYFKWNSFGTEDIEEAIRELGHEIVIMPWSQDDVDINEELLESIKDKIVSKNSKQNIVNMHINLHE